IPIRGNVVTGNGGDGVALQSEAAATLPIERNLIAGNGGDGLRLDGPHGPVVALENSLDSNRGSGLHLNGKPAGGAGPTPPAAAGRYAIETSSALPIDAAGSWFGTADLTLVNALVRDFFDGPASRQEQPAWSPCGDRVVYTHSTAFDDHELFTMKTDGTGRAPLMPTSILPINATAAHWSRDCAWIAFT